MIKAFIVVIALAIIILIALFFVTMPETKDVVYNSDWIQLKKDLRAWCVENNYFSNANNSVIDGTLYTYDAINVNLFEAVSGKKWSIKNMIDVNVKENLYDRCTFTPIGSIIINNTRVKVYLADLHSSMTPTGYANGVDFYSTKCVIIFYGE